MVKPEIKIQIQIKEMKRNKLSPLFLAVGLFDDFKGRLLNEI
jgi:hypothetical protein